MAACRMSETDYLHIPVLLHEAVANLKIASDGVYVDATFGRGSHAQAILASLNENGRLIAFDKDPDAVTYAKTRFGHDKRFTILHQSYARLEEALTALNMMGKVNGILFDLGVSSPQLDNPVRGFSFTHNAELDMRMDTSTGMSAAEWLSQVEEKELARVLWQYGEEKYARRIARAIIKMRDEQQIVTTHQLAEIIKMAIPRPKKPHDKHPATRSFQAIRIALNDELSELERGLAQALSALAVDGRLVVISFHSLEDRIVKQFIKHHEKGEILPRRLPIKGNHFQPRLQAIAKPIKPSLQELNVNPRARSAILRIAEKRS